MGSTILMIGWRSAFKGRQMWGQITAGSGRGNPPLVTKAASKVYETLLIFYVLFSSRRTADKMQFGKM